MELIRPTDHLNPQELTCHQCGRPLEVTTVDTEDGHYQRYLQCWHCMTSSPGERVIRIPLHRYSNIPAPLTLPEPDGSFPKRPGLLNVSSSNENAPMSTFIIRENKRSIQTKR